MGMAIYKQAMGAGCASGLPGRTGYSTGAARAGCAQRNPAPPARADAARIERLIKQPAFFAKRALEHCVLVPLVGIEPTLHRV